jgi:hypothetical protein
MKPGCSRSRPPAGADPGSREREAGPSSGREQRPQTEGEDLHEAGAELHEAGADPQVRPRVQADVSRGLARRRGLVCYELGRHLEAWEGFEAWPESFF